MTNAPAANESMLEIVVDAAAGGHDLAGFELVGNSDGQQAGYQARCRNCDKSVSVSFSRIAYSLLDDECGTPARWRM